jgi:hypothetical protein
MTRVSARCAIAVGTALAVLLGACGHYGPPVRTKKPEPVARESEAEPAEQERERHEP